MMEWPAALCVWPPRIASAQSRVIFWYPAFERSQSLLQSRRRSSETLRSLSGPVPFLLLLLLLCEEERVFWGRCRWQWRTSARVDECGGRLRICHDNQNGDDAEEESRSHRRQSHRMTRRLNMYIKVTGRLSRLRGVLGDVWVKSGG